MSFPLAAATALLQSIAWGNTAVSPSVGVRTIVFNATDDEDAESADSTLTLDIYTPVVIDLNGASGGNDRAVTFTEAGSAVTLLDAAGGVGADVDFMLITIAGVVSPAYEVLEIDGVDYPIGTSDEDDAVVVGGTTFTVQVIAGSPAYVLLIATDQSDVAQADINTLMRSIEYRHTLEGPAEGDRVFTFSPVDANGNAGTESTTTVTVEQTAPTSIAHTTAQAGPWEDPATWTAGVVPGAADTIAMTHHVTANANQLFGHSPDAEDATRALLINSGGKLTIADGVTIRVRGDVQLAANATQIVFGAGSRLLFDNSLCSDPTTEEYQLIIGASGVTTAEVIATGTEENRAIIESYNPSGTYANAYATFIGTNGGKMRMNFVEFINLGSDARYGVSIAGPSAGDQIVEFNDCIFTKTGGLYNEYSVPDGDVLRLQRTTFRQSFTPNGTTKTNLCRLYGYASISTGERNITDCAFDELVHFQDWGSGTLEGNVFAKGFTSGGFSNLWGAIETNVVHWTTTQEPNHFADLVNNYFIKDQNPTNNNPGFLNIFYMTNCTGNILEDASGVGFQGGGIRLLGNPASPKTYNIEGNLMAYNPAGSFGKAVGFHGGLNATANIRNNTCQAGHNDNVDGHESGIVCYGETYKSHTGMVPEFVNNLAYRPAHITNPGYLVQQENAVDSPSDVITLCDYNCVHNLSAGSAGLPEGHNNRASANPMFVASTPGANNVDADPQFVNMTAANMAGWDASLGGEGSKDNAIAELLKMNTPEHNSAYTPAAAVAFVKECLRPTNAALATSGLGGTYIGAVPYSAPSGGGGGASIGNNTDLTAFAEWESDMLSFGSTYATYLAANKDASYPGDPTYAFDTILNHTYYDGERVYRNIASYTGNNAWLTAAADARHVYRRWLTANGHVVPGYWKFTTGMRMAWEINNADATAIESINGLANYGAFSPDTTPLSSMEDWTVSRETAYTLIALMNQEMIGGSHRARLDELLELIIGTDGHFDQWFFGSPPVTLPGDNDGEGDDFTPYQVALSAEALIQYWTEFDEDSRILSKLTLAANWMWDNTWSDTYGQFYYRTDNPLWDGGSELNLVICPLYWWLWKQTGNVIHKTRGDAAFNQGMPTAFLNQPKQFNQVYRWTPAGLLWRDEGNIAWAA